MYLNNSGVASENGLGVDYSVFFGCGVDIPQTNSVIVRCGQKVAVEVGVPRETVTFFLVAPEPERFDIRITLPVRLRLTTNQCRSPL